MKKPIFGKGFAKAMAGAGAAAAAAGSAAGWAAEGQSGVNAVTITSSGGGSATVSVTGVSSAAGQAGSVTVVGGKVWIDGEAIPEDATSHVSPSGRSYKIHRDNGRVWVTTE
jgi:hypothetical protein